MTGAGEIAISRAFLAEPPPPHTQALDDSVWRLRAFCEGILQVLCTL
ncbi:MAG: hypothetical protein ACRDOO_11705 [Actinomadura sp.]